MIKFNKVQIIPTILTTDKKIAQEKLKKYKGIFTWIQLDIVDGKFTPGLTLSLFDFGQMKNLKFYKVDVHLMVKDPLSFLPDCKKINAKRIIGHIELMPSQQQFLKQCQKLRCLGGLAVDISTSLEKVNQTLLPQVDTLLLMDYKAGFGGREISPLVLTKIKKLIKIKKEKKLPFKIALDGGINDSTIKKLYKLGAEVFYVGNYLFSNPRLSLKKLKKAVND